MRQFKFLSVLVILVMVLAACQADGGIEAVNIEENSTSSESTAEESELQDNTTDSEEASEQTGEPVSENASENASETTSEEESEQATEQVSEGTSEEVAQFPVRDEKIPPYEIELRDGSVIKLDQFEGQVVMMTFFTTW